MDITVIPGIDTGTHIGVFCVALFFLIMTSFFLVPGEIKTRREAKRKKKKKQDMTEEELAVAMQQAHDQIERREGRKFLRLIAWWKANYQKYYAIAIKGGVPKKHLRLQVGADNIELGLVTPKK